MSVTKYLTDIDLSTNKLKNAAIHGVATSSLPSSPVDGLIYFDTTVKQLVYWDSAHWVYMNNTPSINPSDFVHVDGTSTMTGDLRMGTGGTNLYKIINLANPTSNQDSATKYYVDTELGNVVNTYVASSNAAVGNVPKFLTANGLEIIDSGFYLGKSVPSTANFSNTTYGLATAGTPGLTTVDFTTALYNKLYNLDGDAEQNVQSNWLSSSGDSFISNKPTSLSDFIDDVVTGNYFPTGAAVTDSLRLGGILAADYALKANAINKQGTVAMAANLPLGGNKITGLGTPTSGTDAATKDYVDAAVSGALNFKGGYDAASDAPTLRAGTVNVTKGDMYTVTTDSPAGTPFCTVQLSIGDTLIASDDIASGSSGQCAKWTIVENNLSVATESTAGIAEIATQAEVNTRTDDSRFITPSKLTNNLHTRGVLCFMEESVPSGSTSAAVTFGGWVASIDVVDSSGVRYHMEVLRNSTGVVLSSNNVIPAGLAAFASVVVEV